MRRSCPTRRAAGLAVLAALVSITACGDDGALSSGNGSAATTAPGTAPPSTAAPGGIGVQHPLGAEDVVVSIGYEGGFVPVGVAFANLPNLLVTGDGTAIVTGPQIAIYPGPLLPNLQQGRLDEATIQELLRSADEHGLLAPVEYARNDLIADASDAVVRIEANGGSFEHRAYALGLEEETDPARAALQAFVEEATAIADETLAAAPTTPYVSDSFLVQARPATAAELGDEIEPTVVPWPASLGVPLATADFCATIPWADGEALFADATQATLFDDGGTTYQLTVVPRLPGREC